MNAIKGISVSKRNEQTCEDLRKQAEKLFIILECQGFNKSDLHKELDTIRAQCTEGDKFKMGIKLLPKFVAQCERANQALGDDNLKNALGRLNATKEWLDDRRVSKALMDKMTKVINIFIKESRTATSLDERVTAYAEMRAAVMEVKLESFEEENAVKPVKFAGRLHLITAEADAWRKAS